MFIAEAIHSYDNGHVSVYCTDNTDKQHSTKICLFILFICEGEMVPCIRLNLHLTNTIINNH